MVFKFWCQVWKWGSWIWKIQQVVDFSDFWFHTCHLPPEFGEAASWLLTVGVLQALVILASERMLTAFEYCPNLVFWAFVWVATSTSINSTTASRGIRTRSDIEQHQEPFLFLRAPAKALNQQAREARVDQTRQWLGRGGFVFFIISFFPLFYYT